ncbi:MAG: hypothetical protein ACRC5W_02955 [Cetobacterium sp.]|uniref:hypothetical protein n=1 Tax=Cetobacterium sp. TaxID=2071632 RepID=UPI003F3C2314
MKKILLLFSLITLIGCSQFSNRKDHSQNISFKSSLLKGKHNFTLISLSYPKLYKDKINFYNDLSQNLSELNEVQKNSINLIITKDIQDDFNSILKNGWFDQEIIGMKIVEDLNDNDKLILQELNIPTPTNAGDIQKLLNQQYYLLLKITKNETMYNSEFLYTELDKSLLMQDILISRKIIIESLNKLKNNFVYLEESNIKNKPLYLASNTSDINLLTNPVIFQESNGYSGFKVLPNSLVLFNGNGKNFLSTEDFTLTSNLIFITSFNKLKEISRNSKSVSDLLKWQRKDLKVNNEIDSLDVKFYNWEAK